MLLEQFYIVKLLKNIPMPKSIHTILKINESNNIPDKALCRLIH